MAVEDQVISIQFPSDFLPSFFIYINHLAYIDSRQLLKKQVGVVSLSLSLILCESIEYNL